MDLSNEDFEMDTDFQEKKMPLALKIFLVILVIAALAVTGYFIWKNFSQENLTFSYEITKI